MKLNRLKKLHPSTSLVRQGPPRPPRPSSTTGPGQTPSASYKFKNVEELKEELRSRKLKLSGNRPQLLTRLRTDDAKKRKEAIRSDFPHPMLPKDVTPKMNLIKEEKKVGVRRKTKMMLTGDSTDARAHDVDDSRQPSSIHGTGALIKGDERDDEGGGRENPKDANDEVLGVI